MLGLGRTRYALTRINHDHNKNSVVVEVSPESSHVRPRRDFGVAFEVLQCQQVKKDTRLTDAPAPIGPRDR